MASDFSFTLPPMEELERQEIPLTHNFFLASAMWLGKYCDNQCKEFMLCKIEEKDPRKCLKYGHEVTDCGLEFFKKVKNSCRDELEWYTKCLDLSGETVEFRRCRRAQKLFDECMYESGFERAKTGHFQLVRVHQSERPKPKPVVPVFEDAVPYFDGYSEEAKKPGPQGTPRFSWSTIVGK